MAIGKRPEGRQEELFVATSEIRRLSHPFYRIPTPAPRHNQNPIRSHFCHGLLGRRHPRSRFVS